MKIKSHQHLRLVASRAFFCTQSATKRFTLVTNNTRLASGNGTEAPRKKKKNIDSSQVENLS